MSACEQCELDADVLHRMEGVRRVSLYAALLAEGAHRHGEDIQHPQRGDDD